MSLTSVSGVNIIGAGLAGSLLAILLAKRGFHVTVYERRPDPRLSPTDSGRSINLALAARGLRGLDLAGVQERVMPLAIPMRGRMVHEHDGAAALQMYGVRPEEIIYSVSRADLNRALIEAAAALPNVVFEFQQLCLGLAHEKSVLELRDEATGRIHHTAAQPSIATDGAGSAVRDSLLGREVSMVREAPLDHDYKELTIPAVATAGIEIRLSGRAAGTFSMNGKLRPGSTSKYSCTFEGNRRCEGPEILPVLDLAVDDGLHLGIRGVGQDGAGAEGARPELHPPAEPAHDLSRGDEIGHPFDESRLIVSAGSGIPLLEKGLDLGAILGTVVGVLHFGGSGRVIEQLLRYQQRRAERAAVVSCRRLNPNVPEDALSLDLPIRDAVEAHAAGDDQILRCR